MPRLRFSVVMLCDLHEGVPQKAVLQKVGLAKDLHDDAVGEAGHGLVQQRLMHLRVERLADRIADDYVLRGGWRQLDRLQAFLLEVGGHVLVVAIFIFQDVVLPAHAISSTARPIERATWSTRDSMRGYSIRVEPMTPSPQPASPPTGHP